MMIEVHGAQRRMLGGGGGQPDSDMKVDFSEIGIGKIGKIGISDFLT